MCFLELVATPATSPRWRLSGSLSRSMFASNAISGTDCAEREMLSASARAAHAAAAQRAADFPKLVVLITGSLLLSIGRFRRLWTKQNLLHSPGRDFRDEQLVRVAAIDLMNGAEFLQRFARLPELADDRAVELHLVDLACLRRRPRVA